MYNKYLPYQHCRSEKNLTSPVPIYSQLTHSAVKHKPPCSPTNTHKTPKKKFDFKTLKNDTCTSLNDVECFLNNFCNTLKYIKLINLLK